MHALQNFGCCLLNQGRFDEVEPSLWRPVHVAPEDDQSTFELAQALEKLGREDDADEWYACAARSKSKDIARFSLTPLDSESLSLIPIQPQQLTILFSNVSERFAT